MSDEEAYELLLKYCGGEQGIFMIKDMIHLIGVDGTVKNIGRAYQQHYKEVPDEFMQWMTQAIAYLHKNTVNQS